MNLPGTSYKAVITDLDGVITQTASVHARAWKKMFDQYNKQRAESGSKPFEPFLPRKDYAEHIDGIPRYDGVKNFLSSRNIDLPFGNPTDEPGTETICGLGNAKNQYFLKEIEKGGVEIYHENVQVIQQWKEQGLKTAIISASKNCRHILRTTGLESLFNVRIDGIDAAEMGIAGKPDPAIFLAAAQKLGVEPAHTIVIEDAIAGVQAAKAGNFALVIGIINSTDKQTLLKHGADMAVHKLTEATFEKKSGYSPADLPSALENYTELQKLFAGKKLIFFLDFDGTLAPIVERHEDAALDDEIKLIIDELAEKYDVSIISGRDMNDVKKRVGIHEIHYAGSHGFEISGPGEFYATNAEAEGMLPLLDKLEQEVKEHLQKIEGARLERKKFAIAIHYRQTPTAKEQQVIDLVKNIAAQHDNITTGDGKKVIELQPKIDWHKGKAVRMLLDKLPIDQKEIWPIYIGDDITDEHAFEALQHGTGILVGDHGRTTHAQYSLKDVNEVKVLLHKLMNLN